MNTFELNLATKVVAGAGVLLQRVPEFCARLGRHALVIVGQGLSLDSVALQRALEAQGVAVTWYPMDQPEPACGDIDSSVGSLRPLGIDMILAIGGGSAMDFAKAVAIKLGHDDPIWLFANLSNRQALPFRAALVPLIMMPTTAGTGAEITPYAVLTNAETQQKGTIQDPLIIPKACFLDPELTLSMPHVLTVTSGLDAFTHALESCINISKEAPLTELLAPEAMRIILQTLPLVCAHPADSALRLRMQWASLLAGLCISQRGTTTTHGIAEPLGARAHIHHGHAVAICTAPVLRPTADHAPGKLAELHDKVLAPLGQGIAGDGGQQARAHRFVDRFAELFASFAIPATVEALLPELDHAALSQILLDDVFSYKFRPLKQHPIEFGREQVAAIIRECIYGR
jgi:alcohol dehydrogenase class IV